VGVQRHVPFALSPGKRLGIHSTGGSLGTRADVEGAENLATLAFDPRTAFPVASRYTDWAVLAHHHVPGIASKHAVTGHSFLHAIFKYIQFSQWWNVDTYWTTRRHIVSCLVLILSIPVSLSKPHYSKSWYLRNVGSSVSNCMTPHSDNLLHCFIPWNPQMQSARRKIIILMSKYFAVSVRSMLDVVWNVQDKAASYDYPLLAVPYLRWLRG
jgi:hypothetical protein